jgi:hypothetical protein
MRRHARRDAILSLQMSHDATFPPLPCFPCPYNSSCCAYGVTLFDEEAAAIAANHGPHTVYRTRWGEWRTRIKGGRCILFQNGGCSIHDKPYYPAICSGFPWIDVETGERYEFDISICGEFEKQPELIQIQRSFKLSPASSGT